MDYFELFKLPHNLVVDKPYNLKKYYELSKKYHPDQYSLKDEEAQNRALKMIANVNEAKKVLDSEVLRLEYLLRLKGYLELDEKYALPNVFLMNVMELNEAIMENKMEEDSTKRTQIENEIEALKAEIEEQVKIYFEQKELTWNDEVASMLKDYYFKRKYLERMKTNLD